MSEATKAQALETNTEMRAKIKAEVIEKERMRAYKAAQEALRLQSMQLTSHSLKSLPVPSTQASEGCERWRSIIAQYGWNVDVAVNVCNAESGGNPANANWADDHRSWAGCKGSFGLFQLNCSNGQVYDPAQNIAIAHSMWQSQGWVPWSSNTCRVKVKCY